MKNVEPQKVEDAPRMSRNRELRSHQSRTASERTPLKFARVSRFNLPESLLKQDLDHVYSFVVYSSGNVEQRENYEKAIAAGWKPVLASEHPELVRNYEHSPFEKRELNDTLVKTGGQVLMKRTKEDDEAERAFYDSERIRQEQMAHQYNATKGSVTLFDQRTRG
jgi:hypothetical protein